MRYFRSQAKEHPTGVTAGYLSWDQSLGVSSALIFTFFFFNSSYERAIHPGFRPGHNQLARRAIRYPWRDPWYRTGGVSPDFSAVWLGGARPLHYIEKSDEYADAGDSTMCRQS